MGAADYLPKPFNAAVLQARLSTSLAAKRLRDLERDYLRDHRPPAHRAGALPLAPGRRAGLERRRRGAPGRPSAGHHGRLQRPARVHRRSPRRPSRRSCSTCSATTTREMGRMVMEYGGTLEHFAGDGILVFFNDPVPQPDHEARAVRMAVRHARSLRHHARGLAQARLRARLRGRHGRRARDAWGASASRAATTTRPSARW